VTTINNNRTVIGRRQNHATSRGLLATAQFSCYFLVTCDITV